MTKHDSTQALDALMALPDAFAHDADSDARFLAAMQEAFAFHYQASPVYRALCDDAGFAPKDLKTADDLPRLPYILVDVFKRHHLTSLPEEQITITFTSSGTSGQKSHIALDQASFDRQALMRRRIIESQGLASDIPVNYLVFSYDPSLARGRRRGAYPRDLRDLRAGAGKDLRHPRRGRRQAVVRRPRLRRRAVPLRRTERAGADRRLSGLLPGARCRSWSGRASGCALRPAAW